MKFTNYKEDFRDVDDDVYSDELLNKFDIIFDLLSKEDIQTETSIENDSIGHYDYGGAKGYDFQDDYIQGSVFVEAILPFDVSKKETKILEDFLNEIDAQVDFIPSIDGEYSDIESIEVMFDKEDKKLEVYMNYISSPEEEQEIPDYDDEDDLYIGRNY